MFGGKEWNTINSAMIVLFIDLLNICFFCIKIHKELSIPILSERSRYFYHYAWRQDNVELLYGLKIYLCNPQINNFPSLSNQVGFENQSFKLFDVTNYFLIYIFRHKNLSTWQFFLKKFNISINCNSHNLEQFDIKQAFDEIHD